MLSLVLSYHNMSVMPKNRPNKKQKQSTDPMKNRIPKYYIATTQLTIKIAHIALKEKGKPTTQLTLNSNKVRKLLHTVIPWSPKAQTKI